MTHVHGRAIILLEGLDKTGKTTAAGEIASRLLAYGPVNLIHFGKPEGEDQFREYLDALQAADWFDGSTIIDRMHWSEEAYSTVYRHTTSLGIAVADSLDTILSWIGGAVILKQRPVNEIFHALDSHDQTSKNESAAITLAEVQNLTDVFISRYAKASTSVLATAVPFKLLISNFFLEEAAKARTRSISRKLMEKKPDA